MRNIHRVFQHQRLFGVAADDRLGVYGVIVVQRQPGQLCANQQNIIPAGQRHLGAHRAANAFAADGHLVNFRHIAGGAVAPGILLVVSQIVGGIGRGGGLSRLGLRFSVNSLKHAERLVTNRAICQLRKLFALFFFIKNLSADTAFVNCHLNLLNIISSYYQL